MRHFLLPRPPAARPGQRACGGHDGLPGSAARPAGRFAAGPLWHNGRCSRPGRGRSNCKRSPAGGNRRTGTDGMMAARPAPRRGHSMDERHPWQDSRPACVPGTMWGTAPGQNLQVVLGAVLSPELCQGLAAPSSRLSGTIPARERVDQSPTMPPLPPRPAVTPSGDARRRLCADPHRR
jgi:hypothetical protein